MDALLTSPSVSAYDVAPSNYDQVVDPLKMSPPPSHAGARGDDGEHVYGTASSAMRSPQLQLQLQQQQRQQQRQPMPSNYVRFEKPHAADGDEKSDVHYTALPADAKR